MSRASIICAATCVGLALAIGITATGLAVARDPGLPNAQRTPGAVNAAVTAASVRSTICVVGYTTKIRPPASYTTALKISQLKSGYNYHGDTNTRDYEEDHLIPLEVGGNPTAVANLWPEPWGVTWNAGKKDQLENALHRLVCAGQVSLSTAQSVFRTNWIAGYAHYVGR
jgi:hypothetical protein